MYKKLHIYFVGIGGIGMSGIAEVLLNLGYPVSGSDLKRSPITDRLKRRGAKIHVGHREKNIQDVDVVVISSAVSKSNPEVVAAHKKGIRVIGRAEMLAEIMRLAKYGIAVAGTHGKTTTTSLIATILHDAGIDPTAIIGGRVNSLKSNAKLGRGDFMLAEADESDGSFLKLLPTIAVVTNMDREHMDHYETFENYREAFFKFCNHLPFYGVAILCGEHAETARLSKLVDRRCLVYGFSKEHDLNARDIDYRGTQCHYDLYRKDVRVDHITLNTPGMHNVLNSLAAIAVADEIGVPMAKIKKALEKFAGVGRRMEVLYKSHDIVVLDDYGHHPAEIRATLNAIRRAYAGRLVVLFQPHRYTRTLDLYKEFLTSFDLADHLMLTSIYAAGETPIKTVSSKKLAHDVAKKTGRSVQYIGDVADKIDAVSKVIKPGDIFLTLGAGDVTKIGHGIAKELKRVYG